MGIKVSARFATRMPVNGLMLNPLWLAGNKIFIVGEHTAGDSSAGLDNPDTGKR
jgi:hypothetical protein